MRPRAKPKSVHAHTLVAKVCVDMATAVFEEALARDNELFRSLRASNPGKSTEFLRRKFVRYLAPTLVDDARATLATVLRTSRDPVLQNEIYDALLKDAALSCGRRDVTRN